MATRRREESEQHKVWTIAEAKARLSEILRLAESEGPQRIGVRKSFVIISERDLNERQAQQERMPLGRYLLEEMPRGAYDHIPRERDSNRPIPYADWTEERWAEFDASDPGEP
ncbi:MAG: hypothetical protein OXN86_07475 [Chloroflexota bacterium]|nr:hypothetical protein [Chloroflexota bacterium]